MDNKGLMTKIIARYEFANWLAFIPAAIMIIFWMVNTILAGFGKQILSANYAGMILVGGVILFIVGWYWTVKLVSKNLS